MAQPPKIKPKTGTGHIFIMLGSHPGKMPRTPRQAPEASSKRPFKQKSTKPKDW